MGWDSTTVFIQPALLRAHVGVGNNLECKRASASVDVQSHRAYVLPVRVVSAATLSGC